MIPRIRHYNLEHIYRAYEIVQKLLIVTISIQFIYEYVDLTKKKRKKKEPIGATKTTIFFKFQFKSPYREAIGDALILLVSLRVSWSTIYDHTLYLLI